MAPLRILVTGPPGIGKTTLCAAVYRRLKEELGESARAAGFLGAERREHGRRVGFDMVTLDETQRAPLASVDGPDTGVRVGKYHVQLRDFEHLTLPILDDVLDDQSGSPRAFIFDEIGKMELFSDGFVQRVRRLLRSKAPNLHVLGTVAMQGGKLIAESKRLPGVEVVEIDESTRESRCEEVLARFKEALSSARATQNSSICSSATRLPTPVAVPVASARGQGSFRLPADVRVRFDEPTGQFSAVYTSSADANFASVNAGDYLLYVGGASINRAFREALERCGHSPKDRYEVLHAALLEGATATPGQLHWLQQGSLFRKPSSSGGSQSWCVYCRQNAECWTVALANFQGSGPYCAACWKYWDDWAFEDTAAFCGLVPEGGDRLQKLMQALLPVGLVSIAVFPENRRPCGSDRNIAMVYVVGPNAGGKMQRKRRSVDDLSLEEFFEVLEEIGAAISTAVCAYNEQVSQAALPEIQILRMCLVSGGVYKHPSASKVDTASSLIRGLLRSGGSNLPLLDFAFDEDAFKIAWEALTAESAEGAAGVTTEGGAKRKWKPRPQAEKS